MWEELTMLRRFLAATLLTATALPALAQEKLVESIEIRVVNVDVVVRDPAGKPVFGLTKGDFEVFEDGRKQNLTNLYEVRPEGPSVEVVHPVAAPAPMETPLPQEMRQRKVVLFIDTWSLHPFRRNQILKSLRKFADGLRPDDQVMIVTFDQGLHVLQGFTSDRARVGAAIGAIETKSSGITTMKLDVDQIKRHVLMELAMIGTPRPPLTPEQVYQDAASSIDAYSELVLHRSQRMLDSLAKATAAMAGLDGKKLLIFAGEHLPERPGAELYLWLASQFAALPRPGNPNPSPMIQAAIQSATTAAVSSSAGSHQRFSIEAAAKTASANGVTLYMLDAADPYRDALSAENSMRQEADETFTTLTNTQMAFETVSRITGGLTVANISNWDLAMQQVSDDLMSYYSLGYRPADETKAGGRRIVVKVKNPAYSVRSRQTYIQKSTDDEMNDRVIANVYNEGIIGNWQMTLKPGVPERSGANYRVPIEVTLMPTITLLPRDQELVGGFTLYIAVGNRGGGLSEVTRSPQSLKIPASAEQQLRSKPMTFTAVVMMSGGENTLSVGVIDQISNVTGLARTTIAAK